MASALCLVTVKAQGTKHKTQNTKNKIMDLELLISLAVGQLGKEKVEETIKSILTLAGTTNEKDTYILKKLPNSGIVMLTTNDDEMEIIWKKAPKKKFLEKMLRDIEI